MSYASPDDFIDRFGLQLTVEVTNLDDPTAQTINTRRLAMALADAQCLIDSYIQGRVQLPLEPLAVPTILIGYSCDIALYELDHRRTREEVTIRYQFVIEWLKDVCSGKANLGLDQQCPPETPQTPDLPYICAPERVFSDSVLSDFANC